MMSFIHDGWRLDGAAHEGVDGVDAALDSEAASLTYGHHSFEFTKLQAADGELLLRLSHRADSRCTDGAKGCAFTWLNGLTCEQPIPCTGKARGQERCKTVNVKLLHTVGRAFFADVARLIEAAERRDHVAGRRPGDHLGSPSQRRTA